MPRSVALFERLMYASLALSLLVIGLDGARRRKNWARIVFVVLFVLGLVPFLQNFLNVLAANPLAASVSGLQLLLQVVALFFVFSSSARPWFKKDEPAHA